MKEESPESQVIRPNNNFDPQHLEKRIEVDLEPCEAGEGDFSRSYGLSSEESKSEQAL